MLLQTGAATAPVSFAVSSAKPPVRFGCVVYTLAKAGPARAEVQGRNKTYDDRIAMAQDISNLLAEWEYDSDQVLVRIITGDDGREKIQLRLDMGLVQMEMSGRPDGTRPEGRESWLEFYTERQQAHEASHPDAAPFQLTDEDCTRLWRETIQYYHRYFSLWQLKRYDLCARDTDRTLRLLAFVQAYARDDRAKLQFDQWRPYVTVAHTRAIATPLVEAGRFGEALASIEAGIDAIRDFFDEYQRTENADESAELMSLEKWREEVLLEESRTGHARPESVLDVLRRRLQEAVAAERFEEAARLRDEIRRFSESAP